MGAERCVPATIYAVKSFFFSSFLFLPFLSLSVVMNGALRMYAYDTYACFRYLNSRQKFL